MAYREIKVYDDPFPRHEQILSGDPTERERFLKLMREYQQKAAEAVRK